MPLHPPQIKIFRPHQSKLFQFSMWWRVVYGILRVLLGIAFLRIIGHSLADYVYAIMSHELVGSKGDFILEHIYTVLEIHDVTLTYFIAGYFIFWGSVDIVLSLCLLRDKIHAFPVTMGLIGLFIAYGLYRYSFTQSLVLLSVILADAVILYLIYQEYKKLLLRITEDTSTPSDPLPHQS
jgi:uncharacterized membrane protein